MQKIFFEEEHLIRNKMQSNKKGHSIYKGKVDISAPGILNK